MDLINNPWFVLVLGMGTVFIVLIFISYIISLLQHVNKIGAKKQTAEAPQQTAPAHAYTGIQKPRQPESTVKPVEINIPDFLKNSRR